MSFEITTLGAFARIQGGYAYKSSDFLSEGIWPVLKIKNIRAGHVDYEGVTYVADHIAEATKKWRTETGDILISMTGSGPSAPDSLVGRVAKVWRSDPPALINQRVGRVCLKDDARIDSDFLFYLLSWTETQQYLVSNSTGSANQVNISGATIESVECPNISYESSKAISSVLGALDERVQLLRETNATLETIAQTLFKSWFVDFDPVRAKAEGLEPQDMAATTAALFPDSFEESEFGLVPKGWRVGSLADLASFQNGYAFKSKDWVDYGHPVVKIGDVKPGIIDLAGCSFVAPESTIGLERFKLDRGNLLVGMTGYVGETGLVPTVQPCAYLNQRVGRFSTRSGLADLGFVYCLVRNPAFKIFAEAQSHGSAQANVSGAALIAYPSVMPSKGVLDQFNGVLASVLEAVLSNHEQAQILTQLRDTLLPRLISGQLRLPEAETLLEGAL